MRIFHIATEDGKNARVPIGRTQPSRIKTQLITEGGEETFNESVHRGDRDCEVSPDLDLIEGDPEIDIERAGMILEGGTRGFRIPGEADLVGDFQKFISSYTAEGTLKEKVAYSPKKANTNDVLPIKMGKRMKAKEAFAKFLFHNHYAISHDDGVKYEFLHAIAKDLHEKGEVAALGAGGKGNGPLIFRDAGTPYRAFLYGEVEGEKYRLLVMVTRMEIKRPAVVTTPEETTA